MISKYQNGHDPETTIEFERQHNELIIRSDSGHTEPTVHKLTPAETFHLIGQLLRIQKEFKSLTTKTD